MLNRLLALDRMVMEVSMRVYEVSKADRLVMRKQNRRLHHLVSDCAKRFPARGR